MCHDRSQLRAAIELLIDMIYADNHELFSHIAKKNCKRKLHLRKQLDTILVDHSRKCTAHTPFAPDMALPTKRGEASERMHVCVLIVLASGMRDTGPFKLVFLYLH